MLKIKINSCNVHRAFIIVILFFCTNKLVGQNNNLIGTWEYSFSLNEVFRVVIYQDIENPRFLNGDYYRVDISGSSEQIVYESDFDFVIYNDSYGNAFSVATNDGITYSGLIKDNTYNYQLGPLERDTKPGRVVIKILPLDILCNPCNIQAEWKVYHMRGLKNPEEPREFNIPTDIILTKVN